ncbi:MAG: DNA polymerase III subunit gamma/tau [bacterium]|nr:DNA polymerase III subunit gamma/tau [bacterium]
MSGNYIPLYRKYRPQTLETLVGQEHIKKTLTSAIELGKISHAYLFTGPRGTGKTSTARILAKSLNCKNGPTFHPCGECESCKDITNSIPIDVIEIDAASNRKVEDAQNLLEKIQYAPVNGKYKIYIIDEVHMLSNTAFNALLKTLEEPPENVIFILATTEVHKVLDTIKSRCQRFDFRRITTDDIVKHLRYISDEEKINITDDALYAIAKNSAGGMRDSISLLDQLSILGITKQVTIDDVNSVLGRVSFDVLKNLSEKIISSNSSETIKNFNEIYNSGNEPLQILTNLSEYFKNLLIVKTCSNDLLIDLTGLNEPQIKELSAQKDLLEVQQIGFLIERISYYIKESKLSTSQHLMLEVCMIDLSNMTENSTLLDLQNRVKALENGSVNIEERPMQVVTRPATVEPQKVKKNEQVNAENTSKQVENENEDFTPPPMAQKADGNDISTLWATLMANIKSPPTQAILKLAMPVKISPEEIIITFKNERFVSQVNDSNKKQLIIEAANAMFDKTDVKVLVRVAQSSDVQVVQQPQKPVEKKALKKEVAPLETDAGKETVEKTENKEHKATDQEKMVMDLFEGKFVN